MRTDEFIGESFSFKLSYRLSSALINFGHVQSFNESWWEFKLSLSFDHQLSCTLIDCRVLSSTLNVFKISMIVDESPNSHSCLSTNSYVLSSTVECSRQLWTCSKFRRELNESSNSHSRLTTNSRALSSTLERLHQLWTRSKFRW